METPRYSGNSQAPEPPMGMWGAKRPTKTAAEAPWHRIKFDFFFQFFFRQKKNSYNHLKRMQKKFQQIWNKKKYFCSDFDKINFHTFQHIERKKLILLN